MIPVLDDIRRVAHDGHGHIAGPGDVMPGKGTENVAKDKRKFLNIENNLITYSFF